MTIEWATAADEAFIAERDHHILASLIGRKIEHREYYVFRNELGDRIGWMRHGYFWDNTPFLNMIWLDEQERGKGLGKTAMLLWEQHMREQGCKLVMTSTQADEIFIGNSDTRTQAA